TFEGQLGHAYANFNAEFVRQCWDAGLKLGHATRSIADTVSLVRDESQVATGLVQTRLLWGNPELHQDLRVRFESWLQKSRRRFMDQCEESRKTEAAETALAVFSLEPDVKRSPGTLRDLQLIRWVGFARHEVSSFQKLSECGALKPELAESLVQAQKYFSEIRMSLHIHAKRSQDVLTRNEQLRLSDQGGLQDLQGQRAVERYMQQYFRKADFVARTARRFLEMSKPTTFQERVSARVRRRILEETYIVLNGRLSIINHRAEEATASLEAILHGFCVAADQNVRVSSRMIETIRNRAGTLSKEITPQAVELFQNLLNRIGHVGEIMRDLEDCGVLELLVPQFAHARGLLQFNNYHAFTVDEHTFRALEAMDNLSRDPDKKKIFLQLNKPWVLSLALLLHDLGKGFEQDHSKLGEQIVRKVADRLDLDQEVTDRIALLVLEHLSMSILAFRRDTSDPAVVSQFAEKVHDAATLRKLYLLTISDIKAVGPGIWNDWKAQLLQELYERTSLSLGGQYDRPDVDQQLEKIRRQVSEQFAKANSDQDVQHRLADELNRMPDHYLLGISPSQIVRDMEVALRLTTGQVEIIDLYDSDTKTLQLTVFTRQSVRERLFHRISGVITAAQFSILSADIYSSQNGFVCDRFLVQDRDFNTKPDPARIERVRQNLTRAVSGPISFEQLFHKHRRYGMKSAQAPISNQKPKVVIDNETSPSATIIDVFAHDRPGLLFTISRAISDLDLSVVQARITTHVDQVVDVFYVTDNEQQKITNRDQLKGIMTRLDYALSEFERHGYRLFES
ncbi:MAG: [protein-PII] uridylyltransferase, partial [Planctomycetaceae bacterium]|nr:[protein-PII] uridylyltransferase [Planctomycetaceae bacterium]